MITQRPGRGSAANLPTTYGRASVGYGGGGGGGYIAGHESASSFSTKDHGTAGSSISSIGSRNGAGVGGASSSYKKLQRRHGSFAFGSVLSQLRNPGSWGYILAAILLLVLLSDRSGNNAPTLWPNSLWSSKIVRVGSINSTYPVNRNAYSSA
jgi:hypothetical protein